MKKYFSLVAVLLLALLCGCGGAGTQKDVSSGSPSSVPESSSSEPQSSSSELQSSDVSEDETSSEDTDSEKPQLAGDGDYVVVAPASSDVTINSTDDFSKYSVGYIDDCDSAVYAELYNFKSTGMYNASNDAHSGMMGGTVDIIIIERMAVANNDKIVWDFAN